MNNIQKEFAIANIQARRLAGLIDMQVYSFIETNMAIDIEGDHGVFHWERVFLNALVINNRLPEFNRVDQVLLMLFALFHDSRRVNEHEDPGHGARGADLLNQYIELYVFHFNKLFNSKDIANTKAACRDHTDKIHSTERLIQICFDADRLDLGRVGITPNPAYLNMRESTDKLLISQCIENSRKPTLLPVFREHLLDSEIFGEIDFG